LKDLDLEPSEENTGEIIRGVRFLSGVNTTMFRTEVNYDDDGIINGAHIYFYNETNAKNAFDGLKMCVPPQFNVLCGDILSHATSVTYWKNFFDDEGYNIHGKSNIIAMLLMIAMIFLL